MKTQIFKFILFLVILAVTSNAAAQTTTSFYNDLDGFYKMYVSDGKVDYKTLAKNPAALNKLVETTRTMSVSESNKLDYQAFWINAYNLHVIKSIVDFYPIASPLDKKGFFDTLKHDIAGKKITLNDIENKLLRAKFNDARVHFVLVCGAVGCPPLINTAYRPELLQAQLDKQTKMAVNDKQFTRIGKSDVALSQLFEWYKADFEQDGTSIDFLNTYLETPLSKKTKIKFYPYDWKLNSK